MHKKHTILSNAETHIYVAVRKQLEASEKKLHTCTKKSHVLCLFCIQKNRVFQVSVIEKEVVCVAYF